MQVNVLIVDIKILVGREIFYVFEASIPFDYNEI
jgi:hypothetical protein